ncbi:MAG: 16S rRNA processing protein RimM [Candidatus Fluviicola riflensis]|nr:MAG: 16S rRNA processing protein RimM [Candidatus Fluviicola riflensis]OGS79981.1 MAG: 16S rRNA processing protein RimM [Candidatus Fluviicola riflensis]OGS82496.1 MAG: 16S rRNA processing protein RimM [Fluviicola sp. RIFCSPHIGHO2_01_FULL_43_53]OGS88160.1 MAG: 16S rRNA processing protein RimM [Fluviicola sp. RIFCSPHIGHO2_12_FULL_43_24]
MQQSDCFQLGYIAKLHGFKGEVSLFLDVTNPADYASLDAFFIELNGHLTPFFVQSFQLKNKGFAAVKLEGVDSENDAKVLLRKSCYLPLSLLPELDDKHFYDHEVIDFTVVDTVAGEVGKLVQVIDLSVNPLLQVMNGEKEILIPFVDGLIQRVDRAEKTLYIKAPEGLIEMYLS